MRLPRRLLLLFPCAALALALAPAPACAWGFAGHKAINRRAVESDLLIYVNINLVPMDGGHKSVTVGLCDYDRLRPHHEQARAIARSRRVKGDAVLGEVEIEQLGAHEG